MQHSLVHEHVSMQETLTLEDVSMQGTLAHEQVRHVNMFLPHRAHNLADSII